MSLHLVPVSFADACAFVEAWHRHHGPPVGHKFSLGVAADEVLVGVAIVGRPLARHFDDGRTLEVTRVATDGTPHAASMLYAAAWAGRVGARLPTTGDLHPARRIRRVAARRRVVGDRREATASGLEHAVPSAHSEWHGKRPTLSVGAIRERGRLTLARRIP